MTKAVSITAALQTLTPVLNEAHLIARLQKQDEAAFEVVFKTHYKNLHAYAASLITDAAAAEELVQAVFFKLWERAAALTITTSIAAYLYRAVHNEALNQIKHRKVRAQHRLYVQHRPPETGNAAENLHAKELEARLRNALNSLPEGCRTVFQLSRSENLRYGEIAARLGISIKTVEAQMTKALKLLRGKLANFLVLLFIFLQLKS